MIRVAISAAVLVVMTGSAFAEGRGKASFYWQPQKVACGGRFDPTKLTAAHRTLPCGTRVEVTNLRNNKSVIVTINDRGPFIRGRVIDLSRAAAQAISMTGAGVVEVKYRVINRRTEPGPASFADRFKGCPSVEPC